jgi:hypothetical protein
MTLSARDKKIAMVLAPLVLLGALVFFVVKPLLGDRDKASKALEAQRDRRDQAVDRERQLRLAKQTFLVDYTTVVRLGKAVPTSVDMPSVLVQLERAARGTKINFGKILVGERVPASGGGSGGGGSAGGSGGAPGGQGSSSQPVAAGGAQAQSSPGKKVENANNASASAGQATATRENASPETDTQIATASKKGGLPVGGGGAPSTGEGGGAAPVAGLDTVPLELSFTGSFFDLADLFHDLKRFVNVANEQLVVRGRLMTIDSFAFSSDESFPKIEAEMKARIFLAPETQGATAGASPSGPAPSGGGSTATASSAPSATSASAAAPGVAAP